MNEVIHRALKSSTPHLSLKLDIFKAFDCVKCSFVVEILKHGLWRKSVGLFSSQYTMSTIIINDKVSSKANISRAITESSFSIPTIIYFGEANAQLFAIIQNEVWLTKVYDV